MSYITKIQVGDATYDIGMENAIKFCGVSVDKPSTQATLNLGSSSTPNNHTAAVGDMVLYNTKEFVCVSVDSTAGLHNGWNLVTKGFTLWESLIPRQAS